MMEPSQALIELAKQHAVLRRMMNDCDHIADDVDANRSDPGNLAVAITRLRGAFAAHNHFEEQVLRPILRASDAFSDVRIDHMFADHVDEHRALGDRLDGPTRDLRAILQDLRDHLAAEERYFLSRRVLRDDIITVESCA